MKERRRDVSGRGGAKAISTNIIPIDSDSHHSYDAIVGRGELRARFPDQCRSEQREDKREERLEMGERIKIV